MAAVMTTGVILLPDWLIMKKVAIPAEIAIIATFMQCSGPRSTVCEYSLGLGSPWDEDLEALAVLAAHGVWGGGGVIPLQSGIHLSPGHAPLTTCSRLLCLC